MIAPLFLFGRRVRKLTASTQDQFAEAIGHAGETLDALETVQAFGREASRRGAVRRGGRGLLPHLAARACGARALMTAAVIALVFGGVVWIFWLGVTRALAGAA